MKIDRRDPPYIREKIEKAGMTVSQVMEAPEEIFGIIAGVFGITPEYLRACIEER